MNNPRVARTALALACMTLATLVVAAGPAAAEDPAPEAGDIPVVETVAPPQPEETDLVESAPTAEAPSR
jgi:ABC-type phosphate/phosphonate transport system substrate-binding protein